MRTISINIDKFAWEDDVDNIPPLPGFYFVYPCRKADNGLWVRGRLLYIGQTENLKQRLYSQPEVHLLAACIDGNYSKLLYTYGVFEGAVEDRLLCEKMLHLKFRPSGNREVVQLEPPQDILLSLKGFVKDWDLQEEVGGAENGGG